MYGKHFASMYEGSMYGIGAVPFAVWGYVISHMNEDGYLELNVKLLAGAIGESEEDIQAAIDLFQEPDPESRCRDEEGRRLVHEGAFLYRVPSAKEYREVWNRATKRDYWRRKQAEHRARKKLEEEGGEAEDNGGRPEGVDSDGVITDPIARADAETGDF